VDRPERNLNLYLIFEKDDARKHRFVLPSLFVHKPCGPVPVSMHMHLARQASSLEASSTQKDKHDEPAPKHSMWNFLAKAMNGCCNHGADSDPGNGATVSAVFQLHAKHTSAANKHQQCNHPTTTAPCKMSGETHPGGEWPRMHKKGKRKWDL